MGVILDDLWDHEGYGARRLADGTHTGMWYYGQLGDGGANADQSTPVAVSGLGAGSGVVAVAGGANHSLAVRDDGSVLAWGHDGNGQLGNGSDIADQSTPVAVSGLGAGSGVVAVAGGHGHSLAVTGPAAPPNTAPSVTVTSPAEGALFKLGDTVSVQRARCGCGTRSAANRTCALWPASWSSG